MKFARIALIAALGLGSALVPVTAQAAPPAPPVPPGMPGYQCQVIYEETQGNGEMTADGQDCTPVNGAPMEGGLDSPVFLADGSTTYVCQSVTIGSYVLGRDCAYADEQRS